MQKLLMEKKIINNLLPVISNHLPCNILAILQNDNIML